MIPRFFKEISSFQSTFTYCSFDNIPVKWASKYDCPIVGKAKILRSLSDVASGTELFFVAAEYLQSPL